MTSQSVLTPAEAQHAQGRAAFRRVCEAGGGPAFERLIAALFRLPVGVLLALTEALEKEP